MTEVVALSIFDYTANALKPWRDAGYECWCVDIDHDGDKVVGGIRFIEADLRYWRPPCNVQYAIAMAWPPCTDTACSGARWFKGKGLFKLAAAIELVGHAAAICEATGAPYLVEQPRSVVSTHWRKPDYKFDPCDYGDPYTKETWLWVGNDFVMPPKTPVPPVEGSKMHLIPPGENRARLRSATPMGFASAVFEANRIDIESGAA